MNEVIPYLKQEIINETREIYFRWDLINLLTKYNKTPNNLVDLLKCSNWEIKWKVIDGLIKLKHQDYAIDYLHKSYDMLNIDKKGKAVEILVSLHDIKGLKLYCEWIKNVQVKINEKQAKCLLALRSQKAIPYLMELLELSYEKEITIDKFSTYNSYIKNALINVGVESKKNFIDVKSKIEKYINVNKSKYNEVKFLIHTIERLEQQYYVKQSQTCSIDDVKNKLSIINN